MGAGGAIVLGFATRRIGLRDTIDAALETVRTTAMLFFIIVAAAIYAYFLVQTRLPQGLVSWVGALDLPPYAVLTVLVLFYVVLGCFLETLGMILITVPVFLPLVLGLGFDPIWFGVLLVVVVEVGLITPPVGMNLFVIRAQQPSLPIPTLYRGIVPFLAADAALVLLLFLVPGIALWLPGLLFG